MRCVHKTREGRVCKKKSCNGLLVCNIHSKECSICLEKTTFGSVQNLLCGHSFHTGCIAPWFERDHRCPYCRTCVRRPKIRVTLHNDVVYDIHVYNSIRRAASALYDEGTLPRGPLHVDYRDASLVLIDLENDTVVAQI